MCQVIKGNAAHDQWCSPSSLIIIVHSAITLLIRHLYCCNIAKSAFQHSATSIVSLRNLLFKNLLVIQRTTHMPNHQRILLNTSNSIWHCSHSSTAAHYSYHQPVKSKTILSTTNYWSWHSSRDMLIKGLTYAKTLRVFLDIKGITQSNVVSVIKRLLVIKYSSHHCQDCHLNAPKDFICLCTLPCVYCCYCHLNKTCKQYCNIADQ